MKIFLDTNVLVSAYTARGICSDLLRYILAEHELLTGEVNLLELRRVLKDRFHASVEISETIEAELRDETIIPKPAKPSPIPIRDPDDRWVRASAVDGQTDLFATGDQGLLAVAIRLPSPSSIHGAAGIASANSNVLQQLEGMRSDHRSYGKGSSRMRVASMVPGPEKTTLPVASCTSTEMVPRNCSLPFTN